MKLLKLLAAGLLAVSFAATASAQTKIYITGSTAFRGATVNAISALLAGTGTIVTASDNASLTSANAVTWTGGSVGGNTVTIKASWSGSAGGTQTVAGNAAAALTVRFLPDGATGTANADPRNTANPAEVVRPDIAMADNLQSSTLFNGTFLGKTYLHLTDATVGVIPFRFVASAGFPTGVSINPGLAQYLYTGGSVPLALFTGANADESAVVYAAGRDPDSGTRIVAMAESGVGVFNGVQQYQPTIDTVTPFHITALNLYPATTINGVPITDGNSGESSGGSLRGFTNHVLDASAYDPNGFGYTAGYVMTYLGVSDAASAIGGSPAGVPLLWNGVDFSVTAVQEGQYTFWGFEHILWRSNLGDGTTDGGPAVKLTFGNNLKTGILNTAQASLQPNVKLSTMNVTRLKEGAQITAKYF
ncbi:MAG: hypothetical protein ABJF10_08280 [Chthoniobacter sp.]|uniref:hypothetical protein n=1 Tax=Chthoniobacter sp. TaxID=2510640 RepID=UPI0032A2F9AB